MGLFGDVQADGRHEAPDFRQGNEELKSVPTAPTRNNTGAGIHTRLAWGIISAAWESLKQTKRSVNSTETPKPASQGGGHIQPSLREFTIMTCRSIDASCSSTAFSSESASLIFKDDESHTAGSDEETMNENVARLEGGYDMMQDANDEKADSPDGCLSSSFVHVQAGWNRGSHGNRMDMDQGCNFVQHMPEGRVSPRGRQRLLVIRNQD
ncbi:hypothetical protein RJ55_02347 [Drechmeria coniospora]|nr:hypothetical protein RJ55_02347 [Drechmeria coniospora]